MKYLITYFAMVFLLCIYPSGCFSQNAVSADAGISASIVKQVGTSKTIDNEFGNGAIIFTGSVKLTPVRSKAKRGNLVLPVTSGTYTAATYYFSGSAGYSYTVSFPTSPMIINSGEEAMQVESFISEPARDSGSDLIAGVFISVTPANVMISYN